MTATIHALPSADLQDIPEMLRRLAGDIESGAYGDAVEFAGVLNASGVEVFGFGRADATVTHYLLACGMAKLQAPLVNRD